MGGVEGGVEPGGDDGGSAEVGREIEGVGLGGDAAEVVKGARVEGEGTRMEALAARKRSSRKAAGWGSRSRRSRNLVCICEGS